MLKIYYKNHRSDKTLQNLEKAISETITIGNYISYPL